MNTTSLREIKKQQEQANSLLFEECGLFFAFSNEQFAENKTPLKEGEKYVSIGGGGYVPKGNVDKLRNGMEANRKAYEKAVKANNLRLKQITYEFGNHECYYTGDWSVVADMFPDVDRDVIERLYRTSYKKHCEWAAATGN
jgi:hypothetical protein